MPTTVGWARDSERMMRPSARPSGRMVPTSTRTRSPCMEDPMACGATKTSPARRAFRLASSEVASGITKPKPSRCMVRRPTSMLRGIRSQVLGLRVSLRRSAGADGRGRPSLHLLQIFLLDYPAMMQLVAGDDVGQCPHCHFVLVGYSAPAPGGLVQIAK